MTLTKTTPILRIFDETKAKAFYVDFLGFTVDWEHRFGENMPLYMQVSKSNTLIGKDPAVHQLSRLAYSN